MTTCPACTEFASNPQTGSYRAQCLECKARSIANSPLYFEASQAEAITPAYRSALQRAFGGAWLEFHQRVKAYAELIKVNVK